MDATACGPAWLAKHHFGKVRAVSFALCLSPALWLCGEWLTGSLGINPLNRLLHFSGRWALIMLMISLSVTPARRLSAWISQAVRARYGKRVSDWNWLIRLRRQLGLFAFFYACLHLAGYVLFDAGPDIDAVREDALQRPFILAGFAAFALLIPLAATSNQAAIRALGRGWRRLHTMSYVIAILAIVHFWMQAKVGQSKPLSYTLVVAALLAWRVRSWRQRGREAGDEARQMLQGAVSPAATQVPPLGRDPLTSSAAMHALSSERTTHTPITARNPATNADCVA